jgi:hypothetical protein
MKQQVGQGSLRHHGLKCRDDFVMTHNVRECSRATGGTQEQMNVARTHDCTRGKKGEKMKTNHPALTISPPKVVWPS